MASVITTVAELIRNFPCSYPNRTAALVSIMTGLGKGYDWRSGEVVYTFARGEGTCREIHAKYKWDTKLIEAARSIGHAVPSDAVTGTCTAEGLRVRAEELAAVAGPVTRDPYPVTLTVPLFTIPPDATPEWVEAAREAADAAVPMWLNPGPVESDWRSRMHPVQLAHQAAEQLRGFAVLEQRFPGLVTGHQTPAPAEPARGPQG